MKIITVSRQFGSGGRELGKRLADLLEWDLQKKVIELTLTPLNSQEIELICRKGFARMTCGGKALEAGKYSYSRTLTLEAGRKIKVRIEL